MEMVKGKEDGIPGGTGGMPFQGKPPSHTCERPHSWHNDAFLCHNGDANLFPASRWLWQEGIGKMDQIGQLSQPVF